MNGGLNVGMRRDAVTRSVQIITNSQTINRGFERKSQKQEVSSDNQKLADNEWGVRIGGPDCAAGVR